MSVIRIGFIPAIFGIIALTGCEGPEETRLKFVNDMSVVVTVYSLESSKGDADGEQMVSEIDVTLEPGETSGWFEVQRGLGFDRNDACGSHNCDSGESITSSKLVYKVYESPNTTYERGIEVCGESTEYICFGYGDDYNVSLTNDGPVLRR
ncbi:MAG: hypothetical protein GY854_21880 [Deltaproteobacteria bacterium]|nr:hypothetical protein [Deltaproteobacteria bacterium]